MNSQPQKITVAELAAQVGGRVRGREGVLIERVANLESASVGDIAFVEDERLLERARASNASCLIAPEGATVDGVSLKEGMCIIESSHPILAFSFIAELLHQAATEPHAIHPAAVVAASATIDESVFVDAFVKIGERTQIGALTQVYAGAVIGDDVSIGRDCVIHPGVVLYGNVHLGNRVILHAGVVVGADGFGYVRAADGYHKFPQLGSVRIADDVEIGAHSCIDRGALGVTSIGRGTKIDNLVQIAHNVSIGERVVIAAQTGISGSTVIEDDAVIGGQVGMGDHARVEKGAIIGSKAGILPGKIVRAGVWWGIPVQPLDQYKRLNAHLARVPQMREEMKELRKQIKALEEKMKGSE